MAKSSLPWYADGLSFKCTGCGKCCSGPSGVVWVTEEEIANIAKILKISKEECEAKYVSVEYGRKTLIEKPPVNGIYDCIFLEGNKCTIYEARPSQCKTFPWWSENIHSPKAWEEAKKRCEGIDHPESILYSQKEIDSHL
jgi:Fe-S-cluster containining protein